MATQRDRMPPIGAVGLARQKMEGSSCLELALEGERYCKAGDCKTGAQFFEAAVQVGTDDLRTLSAIYSQLGNAYFYLQEYGKALEYHKHDLNLARTIGDSLGEAKASGNLGNTLKVLGKYDEAVVCCQRHLDISRELKDRIGESRALYNLGNIYYAKGKEGSRVADQGPGDFPADVKEALEKSARFYECNLEIVRELGDRSAIGRACGNLGNTHYLLGNFTIAVKHHEERLAIAKEFGDKYAERRAYNNLGNAHIFLGEFEAASEHFKKTLQISRQLGDRALEAQACYSLGNTYTLLGDFETAIEYHLLHLQIAQEMNDRLGEGRAYWSLGNDHSSLGNKEKALEYAKLHFDISNEIGDQVGQLTAKMNLTELQASLGITPSENDNSLTTNEETDAGMMRPFRMRRRSMENMELMKLTPDKAGVEARGGTRPKPPKVQKAATVSSDLYYREESNDDVPIRPNTAANGREKRSSVDLIDDDGFFELLSRTQSRRIDDQRCSFNVHDDLHGDDGLKSAKDRQAKKASGKENTSPATATEQHADDFLDMVAGIQGSRMNDQRADLPNFPGLRDTEAVIGPLLTNRRDDLLNDQFFEMLMRSQSSRLEDQRSSLPIENAPTVPDENFFTLIQRVQSNRLDEQRTALPSGGSKNAAAAPAAAANAAQSNTTSTKRSSSKKKKDKKEK